jgi:hypothetical protein
MTTQTNHAPRPRRKGFQPLIFGSKGRPLNSHTSSNRPTGYKAERPAWLGLPMPARIIEKTETGFASFITDAFGNRGPVGQFDSITAALEAVRTAYTYSHEAL